MTLRFWAYQHRSGEKLSRAVLDVMYASIYVCLCDCSCMLFIILCSTVLVFRVADYPLIVW